MTKVWVCVRDMHARYVFLAYIHMICILIVFRLLSWLWWFVDSTQQQLQNKSSTISVWGGGTVYLLCRGQQKWRRTNNQREPESKWEMWDAKCLVGNDSAPYEKRAYYEYSSTSYTPRLSLSFYLFAIIGPRTCQPSEWIVICKPYAEQVVLTPPRLYLSQFRHHVNVLLYVCAFVFVRPLIIFFLYISSMFVCRRSHCTDKK